MAGRRRRPRPGPRPRPQEAGGVLAEYVIVFPALLLLLVGGAQFAAIHLANEAALGAAQEGASVARLRGATAADGHTVAQAYLDQVAGGFLQGATITASRDLDTAQVTVTGQTLELIPGFGLRVAQVSAAPVERFRGPGGP